MKQKTLPRKMILNTMRTNTLKQLKQTRRDCLAMVTRRAGLTAVVAVTPLPGAELGVDLAVMLEMIPEINRRFGLAPEQLARLKPEQKTRILLLILKSGSTLIGKTITRRMLLTLLRKCGIKIGTKTIAKYVPIAGTLASAIMNFSMMKLIGEQHICDCYRVKRQAMSEKKPPA